MKAIFLSAAALIAAGLSAAPNIASDVTLSRNTATRQLEIHYTLTGEPGIVTADIQTNYVDGGVTKWASIGEENFANIVGDVNRVVTNVGVVSTIWWKPERVWPDRKIPASGVRAVLKAWATNSPPDYMVVDLLAKKSLRFYTSTNAIPFGVQDNIYRTEKLVMRRIPAAGVVWRMGCGTAAETNAVGNTTRATQAPPHKVTLTEDYYMGIYEVTQSQWSNVFVYAGVRTNTGANYRSILVPSEFSTAEDSPLRPVEYVSHWGVRGTTNTTVNVAVDWPNNSPLHLLDDRYWLGRFRAFTGLQVAFPTEAQWEYACRAGTSSVYNNGTASDSDVAWIGGNSSSQTHVVGLKKPNAWGLYDMHGNVAEMCLDYYNESSPNTYALVDETDPKGAVECSQGTRAARGGCWSWTSEYTPSCRRYRAAANQGFNVTGFRICCPAGVCVE